MKLTKRQRLQAYKYALNRIEGDTGVYVCLILDTWLVSQGISLSLTDILEVFPEFKARRPRKIKEFQGSWWNTKSPRIRALKKCIEELSPKKK